MILQEDSGLVHALRGMDQAQMWTCIAVLVLKNKGALTIRTLPAALMAIYTEYKHVKETGYLPPVSKEEAREYSNFLESLLGISG